MSEFKFACPVCGQHITADSRSSGTPLECPTCFQKIIVPQAPSSPDSKFILSASKVGKPRPAPGDTSSELRPRPHLPRPSILPAVGFVLVLVVAGGATFLFRDRLFNAASSLGPVKTNAFGKGGTGPVPRTVYPIPTNISWTMDLNRVLIPDQPVAGCIHSNGFYCERATLTGGALTLRQGKTWPPDLGFTVVLFAQQGEELSGKTVVVAPERLPPLPRVILRWKTELEGPVSQTINGGYTLKVIFGQAAGGRMPGQLYIAFPDDAKSFAAGTFIAEIRKPPPPRPPPGPGK